MDASSSMGPVSVGGQMKRILITGATGFIGGRLAEVAAQLDLQVVCLVRTWSRAARLSRLAAQMVQGDILDLESLRRALAGCDTVFHCAADNRASWDVHRRSSVQGTDSVMRAALETGARRVVHLSSIAVFGYKLRPDAATE